MSEWVIQTERLCKTFTSGSLTTPVLFDIDLDIRRGEFVALMGPSGCGKSTLMHILGLMLSATSGKLILDGQDVRTLSDGQRARMRRDKIGFVFQRFNLLHTVNAYQNLVIAQRIRGRSGDGQAQAALEWVGMADRADYKPGQLSIGQQQRVAIARAICHRPEVILADEPTGNLDSVNTNRILALLRKVHDDYKTTIIMITHSLPIAQAADRILFMADGRIQHA